VARDLVPALVALAAVTACTCGVAPTQPETPTPVSPAPPSPALRGRVALPASGADGSIPAVDLAVVPEGAMIPYLAGRLTEARDALLAVAADEARLRSEAARALAENDRRSQEWKATNDADLYRRVEVLLRRPRDPREVDAVHGDLMARKNAAYRRAVSAARRSTEREAELRALEQRAGEYRDARFYAAALPAPARTGRTDAQGAFGLDVPPGRYALVATPVATPGSEARPSWLLWVEVLPAATPALVLDETNRHGTDCAACLIQLKELP
jgi:hypothetical protein